MIIKYSSEYSENCEFILLDTLRNIDACHHLHLFSKENIINMNPKNIDVKLEHKIATKKQQQQQQTKNNKIKQNKKK